MIVYIHQILLSGIKSNLDNQELNMQSLSIKMKRFLYAFFVPHKVCMTVLLIFLSLENENKFLQDKLKSTVNFVV